MLLESAYENVSICCVTQYFKLALCCQTLTHPHCLSRTHKSTYDFPHAYTIMCSRRCCRRTCINFAFILELSPLLLHHQPKMAFPCRIVPYFFFFFVCSFFFESVWKNVFLRCDSLSTHSVYPRTEKKKQKPNSEHQICVT